MHCMYISLMVDWGTVDKGGLGGGGFKEGGIRIEKRIVQVSIRQCKVKRNVDEKTKKGQGVRGEERIYRGVPMGMPWGTRRDTRGPGPFLYIGKIAPPMSTRRHALLPRSPCL